VAVEVMGLPPMTSIAAGHSHCLMTDGQRVWAMGSWLLSNGKKVRSAVLTCYPSRYFTLQHLASCHSMQAASLAKPKAAGIASDLHFTFATLSGQCPAYCRAAQSGASHKWCPTYQQAASSASQPVPVPRRPSQRTASCGCGAG
jgi:hypothetical protein